MWQCVLCRQHCHRVLGFSVNYGEMLRGNRLITLTVTSTGEVRTTLSYHTTGGGESSNSSDSSAVPSLAVPPSPRGAACVTTIIGPHLSVDDYGSLCDTFHVDIGDTMCCQPHAGINTLYSVAHQKDSGAAFHLMIFNTMESFF